MNIFATDLCPVQSALWLDDKRVIKQILESAQMLCTAVWRYAKPGDDVKGLYKPAYVRHPCTEWVFSTRSNFNWLVTHALAMCDIYKKVYNRVHGSRKIIEKCHSLAFRIPEGPLETFVNATTYKKFLDQSTISERYRKYMCDKWNNDVRTPTWRLRPIPEWYSN